MLSYQHSYHAGSLADVHKHAILSVLLAKLVEKNKPLTYIETHAGRGIYDLASNEAKKTGEAKEGILKLLELSTTFSDTHPYWHVIRLVQSHYGKNCYPGSPLLAKNLLRTGDQIHLMELHPQEYLALKKNLHSENIHIHKRDGYEGVLALSPPKNRRGLVFIDPSYEIKSEYKEVATFVLSLRKKWAEAIILIWYPILDTKNHIAMCNILKNSSLSKFWQQEIIFSSHQKNKMQGSGLICIHLPYRLENALSEIKN